MASQMGYRLPVMACRTPLALSLASHRSLLSLRTRRPAPSILSTQSVALPRSILQQSFRRAYTDAAPAAAPAAAVATPSAAPAPKPKRRFRFFRWVWRITYLSALGFVGYLSYMIYDLRNPSDQVEPDPNKKTLVILGELTPERQVCSC